MEFLNDPIFWLLSVLCLIAASLPAMQRLISKQRFLIIAAIWTAGCVAAMLRSGFLPGLALMVFTGIVGIILFAGSLIFSGIRSMPNQRFEDR